MFQVCIRLLIFILLPSLSAATASFELGAQYERLPSSVRSNPDVLRLLDENPGKTQVLVFFSYGCYACSMLDKDFDVWSDKQTRKDVVIYHYPVAYNKVYEVLARAYYTVLALPNSRQLDNDVYDALHNKGINLTLEDNLQKFFAEHGVPADKFSGIYNSFGLDMKIKRARDLSNAFNVINTPYIVVNSQVATYATSWAMANSKEKLFAILDYLIAKDAPQVTTIHD